MGFAGALYPASPKRRAPSHDGHTRGGQCPALSGLCGVRVAIAAQMLCAGFHRASGIFTPNLSLGRNAGLFERINTLLVVNLREIEGREALPSAGVIDSQSVKTTGSVGLAAMTRAKRKRHILTDTCGFLIAILVHAADIQDRDGAVDMLNAVRHRFAWLRHVFADGGYAGDTLKTALEHLGDWTIQIIKIPWGWKETDALSE